MQLSISNLAWSAERDNEMYAILNRMGIEGLEIAPTRIFPDKPYEYIEQMKQFAEDLKRSYAIGIPSIQSIWYGQSQMLFGEQEERDALTAYTRKAIDFAAAAGSSNLVFGCPRNRRIPDGMLQSDADSLAEAFFGELGEYAWKQGCCLSMEANPVIYHTNYMNTTAEAAELVRKVNSKGFRLNLDLGTMIENEEDLTAVEENLPLIQHIHISEPNLQLVKPRSIHQKLAQILRNKGYAGFVSIEMGKRDEIAETTSVLEYVKGVFG